MADTNRNQQPGTAARATPGQSQTGLADQAKTVTKDLKSSASEITDAVKSTASDITDAVTRVAKDQVDALGTAAKGLATEATDRVTSAMDTQKTASADYLGTVAQAVKRAAGEFENDVPQAARYIRQAAGQIENVANSVRQHDMRELVGEVQEFARRQPTLFFGGAMILGFAALRFFKSSGSGSVRTNANRGDHRTSSLRAHSPSEFSPTRSN